MSTLVDPHICPDCRAPLDAASTCTGCGLRLVGPAASELWQRMQEADRLIAQLRAAHAVISASTLPTAPRSAPPARPTSASAASAAQRPASTGSSVPVVLLALGGLCLLVAAVVFVAVAWGSLGLAAKTAILLAVTGLFGAGAVAVTRRDLRLAAETLWLVVAGLVGLDLAAAYGADLLGLGRLSDRDAVGMVGAALLGLAVGVGAWATTTPLRRLHGLVGVAAVGTLLLAGAEAWASDHNPLAVALSVPLLAGLAWCIDRVTERHLRPTALVVAGAALLSWLALVGYGVDRMSTTATDRAWWTDLAGWPLLAAAVAAAVPALAPRAADWLRMVAAGGSLVTLGLFAVGPSDGPTADLLAWAGISAIVAAVSALAPPIWARPAAALTALALVIWATITLSRPYEMISRLPATAPADRQQLGAHLPAATSGPAPWTAIVAAVVVGIAAGGLIRHLRAGEAREAFGRAVIALGPAAVALGVTTGILETEPTLLVAVLAWTAALAVAAAMAVTVRHHSAPLAASLLFVGYLAVTGLRIAVDSHLLAAVLATMLALALALAYSRASRDLLHELLLPVLASATVLTAGFAAIHWPYLAGGRGNAAGLCLAAVAAVALVVARPAGRGRLARPAIELTGLLIGLATTALPVDDTVVAMALTVVGSAVAVVAVLNHDRDDAAWVGIALLGAATVIRLVEDVRAPEVYTLPAAVLLLGAGWWRLDADRRVGSVRALSSGLTLALLPSLLLALDEPVSLRGVLVAAGGLAALTVGLVRHWAAPFVAGAGTTGVLAVRHLGPVVDAVPRWIGLGSVGLVLLLVGLTWEQRRRDVDATSRYLAALR
ncbi:hypothetical protein ACVW00_001358 [Marmoricola sp. URHA0025 HA25]